MKINFKAYLPSILAVLLICPTMNSNANELKTKLLVKDSGGLTCPKGFFRIPSGLACAAENLTSTATVYAPPARDCPVGFERPVGVNICIAKNLTHEVKKGVMLIADLNKPTCPEGFSVAPYSNICKADNLAIDVIDKDPGEILEQNSYILGNVLSLEQANVGMFPGTPGYMVVNNGSVYGTSDWNLLDQPGYSDYDCDSFFATEWGWAFGNNDIDVAQATYIDDDEYLDGMKFYAGSHGHSVTYIGACVGGGLYPNWNCNRVDLRIEKKVNGTWNHVNTYQLIGDPQDLNGGQKYTFVSNIPGYYRAELKTSGVCPAFQRVGIGVAYKDFPLVLKK